MPECPQEIERASEFIYPYSDLIYITVLVPEEEYIAQTGNESAMYAAIDAKKGKDKQVKEDIYENTLKKRIC